VRLVFVGERRAPVVLALLGTGRFYERSETSAVLPFRLAVSPASSSG
jgi:hypothetical protein